MVIRPPRLQPGDTVGVVAPSNHIGAIGPQVKVGIHRLEQLGFQVKIGRSIWKQHGTAAGTRDEQLADLHTLWADPSVKAIIAATGGFTAASLVDRLDYELIARQPKIFVGMSDISFLLNAIHARTGLVTFHASTLAEGLGSDDATLEEPHLMQVLTQAAAPGRLPEWAGGVRAINPGVIQARAADTGAAAAIRGRLVGGSMPIVLHLLGTPYWPDLNGAILFLEPVNMTTPGLMRWLAQLRLSGALRECAGLVIGHMERCCTDRPTPIDGLQWAVDEALGGLDLPVFQSEAFGHMVPNVTLPIGCEAVVSADGFEIVEAAVN